MRCIDGHGQVGQISHIIILVNQYQQLFVQTLNILYSRDNDRISEIAAHEFIHAIGLGHTFNVDNDFMCSVVRW